MSEALAAVVTTVRGVILAELVVIPTTRSRRQLLQTTSAGTLKIGVSHLEGRTILAHLISVNLSHRVSLRGMTNRMVLQLKEGTKAFSTPVRGNNRQ